MLQMIVPIISPVFTDIYTMSHLVLVLFQTFWKFQESRLFLNLVLSQIQITIDQYPFYQPSQKYWKELFIINLNYILQQYIF